MGGSLGSECTLEVGFRVYGLGFRVWGLGFRVSGFGSQVLKNQELRATGFRIRF